MRVFSSLLSFPLWSLGVVAIGARAFTKTNPEDDERRARADVAMDRYAEGDDAAFADLYEALSPRLHRFFLRLCHGERASAEDYLQQTFLKIHRARGSFQRGAHVLPWAFAIGRALFIDDRRRKGRDPASPTDDEHLLTRLVDADQEGTVLANEVAQRLKRAFAELPESQRVALELLRGDGLSIQEASAVLGVSEGALRVRTHRAHEALRRALGDLQPSPQRIEP